MRAIVQRAEMGRWAGLLVAVLVAGGLALLAPAPARAANVVVNSTADTTTLCTVAGTRCLREAITAAGSGGTITFAVTGTIVLGRGTLVIANPMTITGPGAALLTVDANNAVRVFSVPATGYTLISGLTIQRGNNPGVGGGGIYVAHTLTLTGVIVRANTASGAAPDGNGGGIYVDTGGTLVVESSTIGGPNPGDGNTAPNDGGGIYLDDSGPLTVRNGSVIRGNAALGYGGGIYSSGGTTSARSRLCPPRPRSRPA